MPRKVWIIRRKSNMFYLFLILIIILTAGGISLSQSLKPVFSTKEGPAAFYRADIDEKKIAVTFNISWGEERALPILETLREKQIKAAFFISGAWAERHPDIVEEIMKDGHTIGNHGFRYEHYPRLEEKEIIRDLNLSHKKIKDVTQEDVKYFRPPHGDFNKDVLELISRFGYSVIHWSAGGSDLQNPGVDNIVKNVTKEVKPGDVLLLHASDSAKQTGEALPVIIDKLQEDGYEFVELEELISQAEGNVEDIE